MLSGYLVSIIRGKVLTFQGDDLGNPIIGIIPDAVDGVIIGITTDDFDSELFPETGIYFVDRD